MVNDHASAFTRKNIDGWVVWVVSMPWRDVLEDVITIGRKGWYLRLQAREPNINYYRAFDGRCNQDVQQDVKARSL